ncbi:MAG: carboxypeptidase regulatory-like domain-containing protein [Deltaproteobacteria bacterium]|nr:carboxypeptidase regulatory-like domain-containing protein [Deltaproteobacteria bacterium]
MKRRRKVQSMLSLCALTVVSMVFVLHVGSALAKCTIYGKVTSTKDGKPLAGATVTAYDSDTGNDQKMGSATTDGNGDYRITYRDGSWDGKKTSRHTSWRPDIYIKVTAPDHKQETSRKYNNHKLKDDLRINVSLQYQGKTKQTTFDVNQHGFSFPNANWGKVCYKIVGTNKLRYDPKGPFCNADWGLCGGMSLVAGERYLKGQTSINLTQNAAKETIINGQFRTLNTSTVSKFCSWIASPDKGHTLDVRHSVGYKMKQDWQRSIKPRLDRGEPVVLGMIFSKRAKLTQLRSVGALADLSEQHQVLGYDYKNRGKEIEIQAYDPNYPRDIVYLTFEPGKAHVRQGIQHGPWSEDRKKKINKCRAIMFVRGVK